MKTCFLQARVNEEDKKAAELILKDLGTNYSAVINMLLKRIIATKSVPFDIGMNIMDEKKKKSEEIQHMMRVMSPGDTIELALKADTPEEKYFYERLGDYLLEKCQEIAVEGNLF